MAAPTFDHGDYVEVAEDLRSDREGALYRVVGSQGVLRDVRRVSDTTGDLDGIEMRFLAAELRPARLAVLRRYAAQRVRAAAVLWRRAVDDDDEDVDTLAGLVDSAEALADLMLDTGAEDQAPEVAVCRFVSDLDGAHVVQIDTTETTGRVRVFINDGAIYDGDPNTDEPPGARYADDRDAHCDECGAATDELVSPQHGPACFAASRQLRRRASGRQTMSDRPSGYVTIEDTCWPDPTDPRELGWRLRYAPGGLTRRDELVLASIVEAYSSLVCMDSRTRQRRVMQLRDVADVFGRVGGRR